MHKSFEYVSLFGNWYNTSRHFRILYTEYKPPLNSIKTNTGARI